MADKEPTKKPAAVKKPAAHKPAAAKKPAAKKPVEHKADKPVAHKPVVPKADHKIEADVKAEAPKTRPSHPGKNFYAVGKRKTSVAQILMSEGDGTITLNKLKFEQYFQTPDLRSIVMNPLVTVGVDKLMNVKGKLHGGGIHSQAEALRHAISRALIAHNPESRRMLKKLGFLTRDSRVKERKKPGLKRARRAPQFSKR